LPPVRIELGSAATAKALVEPISQLYAEVFSVPPSAWDEDEPARHLARLHRQLDKPSFGVTVALADDELVGFAYGSTMPADVPRWTGFAVPLPADVAEEWEGRTFILTDFAVRQSWRRQGIGRKLLEMLLAGRPEQRATLNVEPEAAEAQAFYQHEGWQKVGRKPTTGSFMPFIDIYVLPLRNQASP
jgi:ribosomal protein S18 acetylase RimI-like enzyme